MNKAFRLVAGVLFFAAITSCSKTDVAPPIATIDPATNFNSYDATAINNIVILGGSTAWGKGASAPQYMWVNKLRAKLKLVNKNDTIINLALPGYSTYDILATGTAKKADRPSCDTTRNITTALNKKPKLVIISLPSNDIADGYSDTEILANYKTLVNTLKKENIPYFLTSNQPRNLSLELRTRLRTFTDLLIQTFPNHVVDYLNTLGDSRWLYKIIYNSGDGIHPDDAGHEVIYNAFITYSPFKKVVGL